MQIKCGAMFTRFLISERPVIVGNSSTAPIDRGQLGIELERWGPENQHGQHNY